MSYSKNFVMIIGGLGKDPEAKYSQAGNQVVKLSIATSSSFKKKGTEEWDEKTEWHNIVAFGINADKASKWAKGDIVEVIGKIETSSWDDDGGVKRYKTGIIADRVAMVRKRNSDAGQNQSQQPVQSNPVTTKNEAEDDLPF